jgi:hypothetical protein
MGIGVKQEIKVLGIGIKRYFWFKFRRQLQHALHDTKLVFEALPIRKKGRQNYQTSYDPLRYFQPDILFVSASIYENLGDFERLIQDYLKIEKCEQPSIFVIEIATNSSKKVGRF